MSPFKFKRIKHGFLQNKVARRIFFLFILCALIPLSSLAYLSFRQVTTELYSQADTRLHHATKAYGMSIFERLYHLESDLNLIASNLQEEKTGFFKSPAHIIRGDCKSQFKGIILITSGDKVLPLFGKVQTLPQLTKDEREHIYSGKALLTSHTGTEKFASIFMIKVLGPMESSRSLLVGEINPEYLWGADFLSPMTELMVLDQSYNLFFSSSPENFPLQEIKNALQKDPSMGRFTWMHKGNTYLASYWTIFMHPYFDVNWILVQSESKTDIMAPISTFKEMFFLLIVLTFLVASFLSLCQIRRSLVPIEQLREGTRRIAARDFKNQIQIKTNDEFEELGASFNEMASSLENHFQTMTMLNRIGIALSAEKNNDHLLDLILIAAKNITNADGCALYTITEDERLRLSVMRIDSIALLKDSSKDELISLYDKDGNPNTSIIAAYSVLKDVTVNIPDIYTADSFDFSGNLDFDRRTGYHSQSFLSVPMKNHENEVMGVLQLTNARNRLSQVVTPFSEDDQRLLETLASQAAVALSKNQLIKEIHKLNEELELRVASRTAQLEAANKEMESFSYSVSHDLRAPLRAIKGFSNILLKDYIDKLDDEGKRLLNVIQSSARKMDELINDLLALSRLGKKEIELSDIDMEKLVKTVFEELTIEPDKVRAQLSVKPLPTARGDQGMVRQVFANLLQNAVKFTGLKENPAIEVGGYSENSNNVYYVKDNGAGFDMRYKYKLFGAFQRLHSGEQFEGTGIGLAIVQRIINRHGGQIWAEGKVNEGATFYFVLPSES